MEKNFDNKKINNSYLAKTKGLVRVSVANLSIMILTTIVSYVQEKKRNNQTMPNKTKRTRSIKQFF